MQSQVNQCRALFAYQIFYFRIVIAFVFSAQYQYCLGSHALQGIPAGVDIGRFGIVDEVDAAYTCHFLQAVFHSLEVGKCLADILFGDTCQVCRDSGSQRVVKVMLSGQCQFLLFHVEGDSFFNSLGTEVTVVEMLPKILGGLDGEISAMLQDIYAKKGIKFNLNCKVTEIRGNEVVYVDKDGQTLSAKGDKILMSVGRRAVTAGLGLENLGIEMNRGAVKVDDKMRTNAPNVFAAGDITGFSMLAHTASREGEVVVNNLTGRADRMRYNAIPGVVYTNPEVAGVGLTEEQAKAEGIECKIAKLPMAYAGRFVAENEGGAGLCKVIVGAKYGEVLGVHMLGNPCSEIIYGACMAIEQEMTLKEMQEVVFPHPTVSEIFKETVFSFNE